MLELEESAQGADLYRAPGSALQAEKAEDQADASGRVPEQPLPGVSRLARAKARRVDLREAMAETERIIAKSAAVDGWYDEVEESLTVLREALDAHIVEVEAPDGLLEEILDEAPRLAAEINDIKREHEGLIESWERARALITPGDRLEPIGVRRRVIALLGRISEHRQRGADLVYEAYNVDIAAGD